MTAPDPRKTRQFYRIRYPLAYRPKTRIRAEDNESEVVELSERGMRFLYQGPSELSTGSEIHVNITFYDGEMYHIGGEILRVEKEDVILHFSESFPRDRIIKEQVYLKNNVIGQM